MTVSTSTSTASYAANGSTTTFAYPFKIFADTDLVVILRNTATSVETVQVLNSDYTVTGAGNVAGGNVLFTVAPASGNTVFIRRELPLTQETDFVPNDPFPADAHEDALDKLTMLVQQGSIDTDRAILFPQSDAGLGLTNVLPSVNDRRSKLLQFANDGSVDVVSAADIGSAIVGANYIVDTFTGTGSTTIYALSAAPGSTNNTAIYIDGVYQAKSNYSVVGSTLTFTTAPPLNSAIEIVIGDAIPAGAATTAAAVSYIQGGTGAVSRNVQSRLRDFVSVKDFGAVGDGVTDDTVAIQAAIDAVYGAGGGTVYFPTGDYVCLTLTVTATEANPLSLVGSADSAVVLKRTATSSQPVLDIVGLSTPQQAGLSIENIKITGNAKTHDGIVATNIAYMSLRNVRASGCNVGLNNKGSLVFSAYDCQFKSNNTGYKADANASIGANLYQFFGGVISANTSIGVDIGEGVGFGFIGTDISGNGTAGDTSTGGVRIRASVDDETGVAFGSFKNCWLELNKGWSFYVDASELNLTIDSTQVLTPESGRSGYFGNIRSLTLINLNCPSLADTIEVNAKNFISIGGQISNITDNSQNDSMIVGTSTATAGVGVRAEAFNPKIGGSASYGVASGVVNSQYVAVGNVGTGEDDLMSYTLPANALDEAGNSLSVSAWGTSANNGNAKTVRLYFAGTLIATLSLTTSQANSWRLNAEAIWRGGGLMTVSVDVVQGGTVTQSTTVHTTLTGINGATTNILKVTGEGVADNDILQRAMKVTFAKAP